jgi:hypothetical protein
MPRIDREGGVLINQDTIAAFKEAHPVGSEVWAWHRAMLEDDSGRTAERVIKKLVTIERYYRNYLRASGKNYFWNDVIPLAQGVKRREVS